MTRAEAIDDGWRTRLNSLGLAGLAGLLEQSPAELKFPGAWEPLGKPGLGTRERWRWRIADDTTPVLFVKRYGRARWREQWDRILRQTSAHSRAHWEFTQSCRLLAAHVSAPPAVGYAEEMRGRFERRSVVVLEGVAGDGFDRCWQAATAARAPITRGLARQDTTRRLARFVAAFHGTGTCHRDLYLCHIFADMDPAGEREARFTVIDLARTHRPRWRRTRWIIKDLSQLDHSARTVGATRADRFRFLLAYLGLSVRSSRARWYARRVTRKADAIAARQARKSGGR